MERMEPIRYKTGEAIRWLKTGAQAIRKEAREKGRQVVQSGAPKDVRDVGGRVAAAAGAVMDFGKSAWADLKHSELEHTEYVLTDEGFDIVKGSSIKSVPYERVEKIQRSRDRVTITLDRGSILIKPHAFIVAGGIKVPVGWTRNGMEVPYDLLLEELSARCGVNIEDS
ncbi:MAG: hypothetical protein QOJ65_520 [Fimbriimonadaceae bacterium]|jgi:hypothetical protein|nr:hypothetical protein [Fimbriimonadaceae bacterium]